MVKLFCFCVTELTKTLTKKNDTDESIKICVLFQSIWTPEKKITMPEIIMKKMIEKSPKN
jgi:hypothetical protein